jgi:carboxypeptidase PM20D1
VVVAVALAVLLGILVLRAATLESRQPTVGASPRIEVDVEAVAARFSEALTFRTISHEDPAERQSQEFLDFHAFLERSFPRVHAALGRETVGDLSLLYTWEGSDPSLDPVLLMGHIDVVPVIEGK